MTGTAHGAGADRRRRLLAAGHRLRARAGLREERGPAGRTSAPSTEFPDDTYVPGDDHDRRGHRRGRPLDRLHPQAQRRATREKPDEYNEFIAISTRCMHLGCPVRYTPAAQRFICPCHGGVYDFEGKVERRPAGAPAGPLLHPVGERSRQARARATRSTASCAASPRATLVSRSTASASTPIPRVPRSASSRAPECPWPKLPKLPMPPVPAVLKPPPAAAGRAPTARRARSRSAKEAGTTVVDWVDERTSLSGGARWMMFRKVPRAPTGSTRWARRRCSPSSARPMTGVFLAMYYDPSPTRRLRVDALHHQRGVPRRVRARHAQVGLDGDGDPRLPAHGRARSSSAPTSTRASSTGSSASSC